MPLRVGVSQNFGAGGGPAARQSGTPSPLYQLVSADVTTYSPPMSCESTTLMRLSPK